MSLADRFAAALAVEAATEDGDDGHLLPARLARATARVLGVDGAGLSVLVGAAGRSPLGASSPEAELAERLQFTAGVGPCLAAHESGQPVFAVEDDLRVRWPAFGELVLGRTSFRGVVSLPLRWALAGVGAMDLFFTDPAAVPRLDVFDALAVGDMVVSALGDAAVWSTWSEAEGPDWLHSPPAVRRAAVWAAVGRTSTALDVAGEQALDLLRAHAYASGRTVDEVAADLAAGVLTPDDVAGAGPHR